MLITFEGIDGSGKSTQLARLKEKLEQAGYIVHVYREPGGTDVSENIRSLLLNPDISMDPVTELLLFSAARSQLIAEKVKPDLDKGHVVLLDRFYDSTIAYQGYGRKSLSISEIHQLNKVAAHGLEPDLTLYLHISLHQARQRRGFVDSDRMEKSGTSFYERVIEGFEKLSEGEGRFVKVDASGNEDDVEQKVWSLVTERLLDNREAPEKK
jgi:dTMP kinase